MSPDDLPRLAEDLRFHAGLPVTLHLDPDPEGLHVLRINTTHFFLNADGSGYDGLGRPVNPAEGAPSTS